MILNIVIVLLGVVLEVVRGGGPVQTTATLKPSITQVIDATNPTSAGQIGINEPQPLPPISELFVLVYFCPTLQASTG
jgi:hypothetical protein